MRRWIRKTRRLQMTACAALAIGVLALLVGTNSGAIARAFGQAAAPTSNQSEQELKVTASFGDQQAVRPDEPIELTFNRMLNPSEGRLAVFIGDADLTRLFTQTETRLRYYSKLLPLKAGRSDVTIYRIDPANQWRQIAQFPLLVSSAKSRVQDQAEPAKAQPDNPAQNSREGEKKQAPSKDATAGQTNGAAATSGQANGAAPIAPTSLAQTVSQTTARKLGFDKLNIIPSVTLSLKSQAAESAFPFFARSLRPTFIDTTIQATVRSDIARGSFASQSQFDFAGSSFRQEAVRFAQLGERAPLVDLTSYLIQIQIGKVKALLGHTSYGSSRQLINNFSSRGMVLTVPFASRFELTLAALNGTVPVGYGNFLGLDNRKHQLLSGTLGVEVFAKRPGGLRFEVALLDGAVQPLNSFNQGSVNDSDRSRGWAIRISATDPQQRLRIEGGFTRSRFENAVDPLLSQGNLLAPLAPPTRNARYLDASYTLLKDLAVSEGRKANLTFTWRHEMLEPLFKSLGAATQADKAQNQFDLSGNLGEINFQIGGLLFNDNLFNVPSILKSLTRAQSLLIRAPVAMFFAEQGKPSPWLPRVTYAFNRTHQYAAFIPVSGGFEADPNALPNLVGTDQSANADWQFSKWRLGYRLNHSLQDNRQPLRPFADISNFSNGLSGGITATNSLSINFDLTRDAVRNRATNRTDNTFRLAPSINWLMTREASFAATFSIRLAGNNLGVSDSKAVNADLQWAYRRVFGKDGLKKLQGQFFIRYANRYALNRDRVFLINNLTRVQTLNLGLSFTFF